MYNIKIVRERKIIVRHQYPKCFCKTICPKMDKDHKFNGLVLPLAHGWTIWYFSFLHLFTSLYAFYNNYYILGIFGFGSMGSSLHYWKYPQHNSLRRYIDITIIQITFYTHMYYALYSSTCNGYLFFTGTGIICYIISNHYISRNLFFATFYHILVHIFASMGNVILYSGSIEHT
jgi:hypothetical protein